MTDEYLISGKTCTERDKYYKSCIRCGLSSKGTEYEATFEGSDVVLGHSFTAETVDAKFLKDEATCTEAAVYYKSCIRCGASSKDTADEATFTNGDPLGHSMVKTEAKEETCTVDGNIAYYTCSTCEKIFKDEAGEEEITLDDTVIKAAHLIAQHPASAPDCTHEGNEAWEDCHREGCGYTTYKAIPALGHSFGEWVTVKEPTATEKGLAKRTCSACGTEETKDLDTVSDKDDDSDLSCLERIINLFKKILLAFAAIFGCGCGGSSAGN